MAGFAKKKYLKLAKGFKGVSKHSPRAMIPRVEKSLLYAYVGRKLRPRMFQREWVQSINSAVRQHNLRYSVFIYGLRNSNLTLNRKILSDLARNEPYSFKAIVDQVKIQAQLQEKKKLSLQQLLLKNLITTRKLPASAYDKEEKKTIAFRVVNEEL